MQRLRTLQNADDGGTTPAIKRRSAAQSPGDQGGKFAKHFIADGVTEAGVDQQHFPQHGDGYVAGITSLDGLVDSDLGGAATGESGHAINVDFNAMVREPLLGGRQFVLHYLLTALALGALPRRFVADIFQAVRQAHPQLIDILQRRSLSQLYRDTFPDSWRTPRWLIPAT